MNPAYPDFGEDCTNFVSQCMKAGGWATVGSYPWSDRGSSTNWWNGSYTWSCSYTWGGAENWYWFGLDSGRTYILGSVYDMGYADVLQYDFNKDGTIDHTQICTGWNATCPLMTQHSSGYRDVPLTDIFSNPTNGNAWHYAHRT